MSNSYDVRRLRAEDLEQIYALSCGNEIFYQYHPPFVTRESILEDMEALPPEKGWEDKFYVGFFDSERLVAVMDLIRDFPKEGVAFVGLFMMEKKYQGRGVGSKIIGDCMDYLRELGFKTVQLGVDKGNPQSFAFWSKNGFVTIEEKIYIRMEREL